MVYNLRYYCARYSKTLNCVKKQKNKKKVLQQQRNTDRRVRVNSFLSELELTHGVCVEFI